MRRGGGSRGGSFGGGGSSRSSGFRGGSSRMHRTSRRHHRHRRYYGGGYYGRRYYGHHHYGRRGGSIVGLLVFLFIFFLVIAAIFAGVVSSPTNYNNLTLAAGTSYALDYSQFSDGAVSIEVTNGDVETYIFDSEPSHQSNVDLEESFSGSLGGGEYNWYSLALSKGTQISATWNAASSLTYYAIRGDSNLNSWEEGSDTQFYDDFGDTGTHSYTVNRADNYYFALEYFGSDQNSYTIDFIISVPVHDLSNPNYEAVGSQNLQPDDITGKSIILFNPAEDSDSTVNVVIESAFSFGTVFWGTMLLVVGGLVAIYKRSEGKKTRKKSGQAAPPASGTAQKTEKKTKDKYMTRPDAKFCSNCGSGVLPKSKFCIECGQSISA